VKPDIDYTYEIRNLAWLDGGSDADQDGYVTTRILRFDVYLMESVTRDLDIKIYYKLSTTSTWIFYTSTEYPGMVGGTEESISVMIGLAKQLAKGNYDFLVEVYEVDKDRLEASASIKEAVFERLVNDTNFDLEVSWFYPYDYDHDGYPSHAILSIDVDVQQSISKEVRTEVFYRMTGSSEEFSRYYRSEYYEIFGTAYDPMEVPIGQSPDTLSKGTYDFRIIVWERNNFSPVLIYEPDMDQALNTIPFESEQDDYFVYSINENNTSWSLTVDQDGDGYAQTKVLALDIDTDKTDPVDIFVKIYRMGPDDEDYLILDSTAVFTVTGKDAADIAHVPFYSTLVTDSVKMPHASYDLMLSIFEVLPDANPDLRFATDSINGQLLMGQLFELADEDK